MKKNSPKIAAAVFIVFSTAVLSGCAKNPPADEQTTTSKDDTVVPGKTTTKTTTSQENANQDAQPSQQLMVDEPRCIGCGRCVSVAPENFQMDSNRKAKVISQYDLEGSAVKGAIRICPANAIILEKA